MTPQERIKADAEDYAGTQVWVNKSPNDTPENLFHEYISANSYIAGATAEHGRAQVLVDALEEVAKLASIWPQHGLDPRWVINAIEKKLTSALEQWKGKEPDRPCPRCGKELSRDRNLCCRECGKEVEP